MSNKNKNNQAGKTTPGAEAEQTPAATHVAALGANTMNDIDIKLPLGRPINPDSERQKRLAGYAEKQATEGTLHRGRPKDPNSKNAIKQAARDLRLAQLKEAAIKANQMNAATGGTGHIVAPVKSDGDINIEVVKTNQEKAEMVETEK